MWAADWACSRRAQRSCWHWCQQRQRVEMGRHSPYLFLVMTRFPPGLAHQTGRKKGAGRGSEGRGVLQVEREAGCWGWETRSARSEEWNCQTGQE